MTLRTILARSKMEYEAIRLEYPKKGSKVVLADIGDVIEWEKETEAGRTYWTPTTHTVSSADFRRILHMENGKEREENGKKSLMITGENLFVKCGYDEFQVENIFIKDVTESRICCHWPSEESPILQDSEDIPKEIQKTPESMELDKAPEAMESENDEDEEADFQKILDLKNQIDTLTKENKNLKEEIQNLLEDRIQMTERIKKIEGDVEFRLKRERHYIQEDIEEMDDQERTMKRRRPNSVVSSSSSPTSSSWSD